MPPVRCMDCMDAGFAIYDGVPRACGSCDAGAEYERNGGKRLATVPRSELNPMTLPPGGDVVITEMKRQAAGLPVGVIGSDVLIRAEIESQPLVHELVRLVDDFIRDVPGVVDRAGEVVRGLPAWAIPDDVRNRSAAPPQVDGQEPLVPLPGDLRAAPASPSPVKGKVKPAGRDNPAAPLEPPD